MFTQVKFLQMNLREIFAVVSLCRAVNIAPLEEKPYSKVGAERVQTKYGISVLLTIRMSSGEEDVMRVFLSKGFTPVFSDTDLDIIKGGIIKINLIYHGTSEKTNAYQLSLKEEQE